MRRYFPYQLSRTSMERLGEEHDLVPSLLTKKGHFHIASKLNGLRRKRAMADYDINAIWDVDIKKEAENAMQLSSFIIGQIKASPLLKHP